MKIIRQSIISRVIHLLLIFILITFATTIFALPFTIVPNGALPTTITAGQTLSASYTVTNNTAIQRNNNFVKFLPTNVSVAAGGCGQTFNLASKASCNLNLSISGPVDSSDTNPMHALIVCLVSGTTCAGTTSPLNVALLTLTSLSITPQTVSVAKGSQQAFTATANYSDGSTSNVTSSVTWTSSDHTIATINSAGSATAHALGTATINATYQGVSAAAATMTVTAAQLASITISATSLNVTAGFTQPFTALGTYTDGTTKDITSQVTWASGTTSVATISITGLATGLIAGATSISANLSGIASNILNLTVSSPTLISLSIISSTSVAAPMTYTYALTGHFSNGTTATISNSLATWTSTNSAAATIGATGIAQTVAAGVTLIKATYSSHTSNVSTFTVTNASLLSIAISATAPLPVSASTPLIVAGKNVSFTAIGTFSDTTMQDITNDVTWSSGTPSAATIDGGGYATGITGGEMTNITATTMGVTSNSVPLTVRQLYFFIANRAGNSIVSCSITGAGATLSCTTALSGLTYPQAMAIGPTGAYAYFANNSGTLTYCTISSTGTLSSCNTDSSAPTSIQSVALNPSGSIIYVITSDTLYYCNVNTTTGVPGACNSTDITGDISAGAQVIVNPSNSYLYFSVESELEISYCAINSDDGSLVTPCTQTAVGSDVLAPSLNPMGSFAYLSQTGSTNLTLCTANSLGPLTPCNTTFPVGSTIAPITVLVNAANTYVYALDAAAGTVYSCPITNSSTGALGMCGIALGTGTLNGPIGMAIG